MIGVYWGRFNPPHKGHLKLIKKLSKETDKLIIAIGDANTKNTKRNPFDGNERKKMLEAYLKEEKLNLKKVKVVAVPHGKTFSSSINKLFKYCGDFDVIYTDKKKIIHLIEKRVIVKKIKRKGKISSTQIRDAIANNKSWETLTGKSVVKIIKKLNGIKRIKKVY